MPKLPQPIIEVAWRQAGEENKIHYRARRPDGSPRRLLARQGDGLYDLLEQHLAAIGYTALKALEMPPRSTDPSARGSPAGDR